MARTIQHKQGWIGWLFFSDLWAGLRITLRYMFSKTITHHYPDREKWIPYPRHRGHHYMNTNEAGENNCVACELCSQICPCNCITVVPFEDQDGSRHPKIFDINLARCLFCGLCEDACPADAIKLGQEYEIATTGTNDMVVHLDDLLKAPRKAGKHSGTVVTASLDKEGGTKTIVHDAANSYDWWQLLRHKK